VVLESCFPDLDGVESAASVARESLDAARKSRRSAFGVSFGGLPGRGVLENRSWPVLFFSLYMMFATVGFVSSVSRPISLYVFPTLYHAYTSARFSIVVSRREVITLEGIFKEKREERKFVREIFMVGWWGGGVCGSFSKLGFTKNRVFTFYT
jgi:hypothetical protein